MLLVSLACHVACMSGCHSAGTKGCVACKDGYVMSTEEGCEGERGGRMREGREGGRE